MRLAIVALSALVLTGLCPGIVARYDFRAVVIVAMAMLVSLAAATVSPAATHIYCASKTGSRYLPKIAPKRCTAFGPSGSFAGGVSLASLHWSGWGGPSATATGIEQGFHLPRSHIPVSAAVYRRKRDCSGRLTYTRLRAKSSHGTTRVRLATCRDSTFSRVAATGVRRGRGLGRAVVSRNSRFRDCRFDGFTRFPSVTALRARDTSCRTARRLARKAQDNGSSLQPLINLRGNRWKAKYISRTEGDAVWYRAVLRSRDRVVTMNLGS
jgi:hypothetical protein